MIVPMLVDSLLDAGNLLYIGLFDPIPMFRAPLNEQLETEDDESKLLLTHTRQSLEHARHLWQYVLLPTMYPWAFVKLLSPSRAVRESTLAEAQQVWDLILRLEKSRGPSHVRLCRTLFVKDLAMFRELFNMLESTRFTLTERILLYIKQMSDHVLSSLSLEDNRAENSSQVVVPEGSSLQFPRGRLPRS